MKIFRFTLWLIVFLMFFIWPACSRTQVAAQGEGACTDNAAALCISFEMTVTYPLPRSITANDVGAGGSPVSPIPLPDWVEHCIGRLSGGTYRYFTNGTAPSATVGTLVPTPPQVLALGEPSLHDSTGTLEDDGSTVLLYSRELVLGFKAMEVHGGKAVIYWECTKPGEPPPAAPPSPPRPL